MKTNGNNENDRHVEMKMSLQNSKFICDCCRITNGNRLQTDNTDNEHDARTIKINRAYIG